jgi:hypothetical protein
MDIKDGFATSSKEHLRSLVRVHELDEITSNGGKDRSATRNTPGNWSVKDRTSYAKNLHLGREDDIVKIMQVEGAKCINHLRTHRSEGVTEPGRDGPGPVGPAHPGGRFAPPFLAPEGSSTLKPWRRRHSTGREPFAPGGHPQARERREISEGRSSTLKEAPSRGKEGRHRRKGNHDQRCYVQHFAGVISLFVHGL